MKKEILVVRKELLFGKDYFEGFAGPEINYIERINNNFIYKPRDIIEHDTRFKQPIAYNVIVNSSSKKIFSFQRANNDKDYGERRLQGKWSWGFGGHIDKGKDGIDNPVANSLKRELKEELKKFNALKRIHLGYINCDFEVHAVHFGILYITETDAKKLKPLDREIAKLKPRSIDELEEICLSPNYKIEEWSKIALKPLREYLRTI